MDLEEPVAVASRLEGEALGRWVHQWLQMDTRRWKRKMSFGNGFQVAHVVPDCLSKI